MRQVDFYKLPRAVQDQFVASARSAATPMLRLRAEPRLELTWGFVALVSAALVAAAYALGHGVLGNAFAIQPLPAAAVYVTGSFVTVFGLLRIAARRRALAVMPYPAAVYVFPASVVDARSSKLGVYPTSELESSGLVPGGAPAFRFTFQGGKTFTFPLPSADRAEAVLRGIEAARTQVDKALASKDPRAMAALDPLYDSAFASPIGPTEPLSAREPAWSRASWLFAALFALAAGPGLFLLRNARSDDRMFATAKAENTVAGYRAYLDSPAERHREVVAEELLPRAELRVAEQAGSVDAIEGYIDAHPKSAIGGEISAARRTAMLAELEGAKKVGTLAAVAEFVKRHPVHNLEPEIAAAKHAVYAAALEGFRRKANDKEAATVVPFVERLVALAERGGPVVQVRFRRKASKSLARADGHVAKHKSFTGVYALPSRYFDDAHQERREAALASALGARFAEVFSPEILRLERGELVVDLDAPLPPVTVPTYFVEHVIEWSGTLYPTKSPRGVFAGFIFSLDGSFRLPDAAVKPLRVHVEQWRPAEVSVFRDEMAEAPVRPRPGEDPPEGKVYEAMSREAFDGFAKKTGATFFKQASKPGAR